MHCIRDVLLWSWWWWKKLSQWQSSESSTALSVFGPKTGSTHWREKLTASRVSNPSHNAHKLINDEKQHYWKKILIWIWKKYDYQSCAMLFVGFHSSQTQSRVLSWVSGPSRSANSLIMLCGVKNEEKVWLICFQIETAEQIFCICTCFSTCCIALRLICYNAKSLFMSSPQTSSNRAAM